MELEEFQNKRWRHSEEIIFTAPNDDEIQVSCILQAVDFEQSLMKLMPIDIEEYCKEPFWSRVEYCKRPSPRMKKV